MSSLLSSPAPSPYTCRSTKRRLKLPIFGKARNNFAISRRRRNRKEGLGGERVINCGWEGDRGDQGCEGFRLVFSDCHYRFRNTLQNGRPSGRTVRTITQCSRPSPNKPRQSGVGVGGIGEWESESDGMRVNLKRAAHFHIAAVFGSHLLPATSLGRSRMRRHHCQSSRREHQR